MGRGRKPKGLGDVVENITSATGIKKAVETLTKATGIDCGCEKRKEWLNKKFRLKANCLVDTEIEEWKKFNAKEKKVLTYQDQVYITSLLKKGYNISVAPCSNCGASQWLRYIEMIDELTV